MSEYRHLNCEAAARVGEVGAELEDGGGVLSDCERGPCADITRPHKL